MSHELEEVGGKAMMAYAGETPWHNLGKKVSPDLSPAQMLKAADLDWTVAKIPAYITFAGKKRPINWSALVRESDGKILSTVSPDWKTYQNAEAFQFFHEYCEAGDMEMNTAGSLHGGTVVWALAKIKDGFILKLGKKKDEIQGYMLFVNPHQWARSLEVRLTPIRVVCDNTLTLAMSTAAIKATPDSKGSVRVSHKKVFDPDKVKEQLGIARGKLEGYKQRAELLVSKRYKDKQLQEFFKQIFPVYQTNREKPSKIEFSKRAVRALDIVEKQPGATFAPESWWNAFNAATFLVDHEIGRTDDSRMHSAWFGTGHKTKVLALNKAVEFAQAG